MVVTKCADFEILANFPSKCTCRNYAPRGIGPWSHREETNSKIGLNYKSCEC